MEGSLAFMRKLMDEAMGALTTASQPGRGRESEGPTAAEALIKGACRFGPYDAGGVLHAADTHRRLLSLCAEASAAAASTAASAEKLGATFTKRAAGAITGGLVGGFNTLTSSALRTGGSLLGSLIEGLDSLQRRAAAVEAERAFLGLLNEELRDEVVRWGPRLLSVLPCSVRVLPLAQPRPPWPTQGPRGGVGRRGGKD